MRYEKYDLSGDGRVILYCYLHHWTTTAGEYPERAGVLVLPGGAYVVHGASEGEPVAQAFFSRGYHAFYLRYSIERNAVFPESAADVGRAMQLIRSHAEDWNLNPEKLAVCGFSAGGHVAACIGTMYDQKVIRSACNAAPGELRPDALILGYPCITADIEGQRQMFEILAGDRSLEEIRNLTSAELYVTHDTPPVFLWNIFSDQLVPVEQGLLFLQALAANDVPFEAHTYQRGVHGSALGTPVTSLGSGLRETGHVYRWFDDCCLWLEDLFGKPVLNCDQQDLYFPDRGRAHLGQPVFPDDLLSPAEW